eukprot:5190106-Amphidinium_carterae.1
MMAMRATKFHGQPSWAGPASQVGRDKKHGVAQADHLAGAATNKAAPAACPQPPSLLELWKHGRNTDNVPAACVLMRDHEVQTAAQAQPTCGRELSNVNGLRSMQ